MLTYSYSNWPTRLKFAHFFRMPPKIHNLQLNFNYFYPQMFYKYNNFKVGFPFEKLLRIFCGTKRKIFLSLRISFARKNNNLRNHSQKSFRAKLPFSTFVKLKFWAIPQFRQNQTVGDGVCFLEFNF